MINPNLWDDDSDGPVFKNTLPFRLGTHSETTAFQLGSDYTVTEMGRSIVSSMLDRIDGDLVDPKKAKELYGVQIDSAQPRSYVNFKAYHKYLDEDFQRSQSAVAGDSFWKDLGNTILGSALDPALWVTVAALRSPVASTLQTLRLGKVITALNSTRKARFATQGTGAGLINVGSGAAFFKYLDEDYDVTQAGIDFGIGLALGGGMGAIRKNKPLNVAKIDTLETDDLAERVQVSLSKGEIDLDNVSKSPKNSLENLLREYASVSQAEFKAIIDPEFRDLLNVMKDGAVKNENTLRSYINLRQSVDADLPLTTTKQKATTENVLPKEVKDPPSTESVDVKTPLKSDIDSDISELKEFHKGSILENPHYKKLGRASYLLSYNELINDALGDIRRHYQNLSFKKLPGNELSSIKALQTVINRSEEYLDIMLGEPMFDPFYKDSKIKIDNEMALMEVSLNKYVKLIEFAHNPHEISRADFEKMSIFSTEKFGPDPDLSKFPDVLFKKSKFPSFSFKKGKKVKSEPSPKGKKKVKEKGEFGKLRNMLDATEEKLNKRWQKFVKDVEEPSDALQQLHSAFEGTDEMIKRLNKEAAERRKRMGLKPKLTIVKDPEPPQPDKIDFFKAKGVDEILEEIKVDLKDPEVQKIKSQDPQYIKLVQSIKQVKKDENLNKKEKATLIKSLAKKIKDFHKDENAKN